MLYEVITRLGCPLGPLDHFRHTPFFLGFAVFLGLQGAQEVGDGNRTAAHADQHIFQGMAVELLQQQPEMTAFKQAPQVGIVFFQFPFTDLASEFERSLLFLAAEILANVV